MLQEMVHQLLTPNVVSWSAAISVYEKGKQLLKYFLVGYHKKG